MPHVEEVHPLLTKTKAFVRFLRDAAAIKTRPIDDVQKYPTVLWLSELSGLPDVRSPLFSSQASSDDGPWLVVPRVPEPDCPAPPDSVRPWLDGVTLDAPGSPPVMNAWRSVQDPDGQVRREGPTAEAQADWVRYLQTWQRWAEKAKVARALRPIYQKLFKAHQELQGRADAFDVVLAVGLLHVRAEGVPFARRHLLAFRAEIVLDERTGTILVTASPDFTVARVETDFLDAGQRARLRQALPAVETDLAELGPAWHERETIQQLLTRLTVPFDARAQCEDSVTPVNAPMGGIRTSFAPAVIVRPKGIQSYQQLLDQIERATSGAHASLSHTQLPLGWRKMMDDSDAWAEAEAHHAALRDGVPQERVYFPLPSNDEQSRIVKYAGLRSPGVVVQGPPGTGKSHTIANLIAHYLATGQRVLVTAQTAQALAVLQDKLPQKLAQLCVSLLGDSRSGQHKLRDDVGVILNRLQEYHPTAAERRIERLDRELVAAETELANTERTLRQARAEETEVVEPVDGYRGTRAEIARRLRDERPEHGWLSDPVPHTASCPHFEYGWERLADYHASLSSDVRRSLALSCPVLPFAETDAIQAVEDVLRARRNVPPVWPPDVPEVPSMSAEELDGLGTWLQALEQVEAGISDADREWSRQLRRSLTRRDVSWDSLRTDAQKTLERLDDERVAAIADVTVSSRSTAEARRDLTRLHQHYAQGGARRRYGIFKPAIVKECEWVETAVSVEGLPARTPQEIDRARRSLDASAALDRAWHVWQQWATERTFAPRAQVALLRHRTSVLEHLLDLSDRVAGLQPHVRAWVDEVLGREVSTRNAGLAVEHVRRSRELEEACRRRDELCRRVREVSAGRAVVPAITTLLEALEAEDVHAVAAACREHAGELARREFHSRYVQFVAAVKQPAPQLAADLESSEGTSEWRPRCQTFEAAWAWRRTKSWLDLMLSENRVEALHRAARDQRQRCQDILAELTAERAWHHALGRLTDRRRADLVAWATAVARIPRTGKTVFQRRAVAQELLGRCLDSIPAWVVSLNRLYETVQGEPGMFDVAIVDEASQCWLDSLILLFLAKRVIVVGDDKQISPMMVGVRPHDVHALTLMHLRELRDGPLFTIESSLFDHARRYLSAGVPLREHFRCVPEIIQFSNDLCYQQNPLIPLRQVGADRLEPLKRVYVEHGHRNGDINAAEAEAIVDAIARCHRDPAYDELDFGVICLQGEDQGHYINHLLLERLGVEVFGKRHLRCGNPYVFQGDERDVMFISMVAARNVQQNALTGLIFEQRFNVAMSRARDQAWLFHSVQEDDLGPACLRRRVLTFFKDPPALRILGVPLDIPALLALATRADRRVERPPIPFDSWFELDVALALEARGFNLSAQVEVAGRRIDLVVEGTDGTRLAVECDGERWHGHEQFEQDVARQRQLERAGWTFARVRESLFYADGERAIDAVVGACEELGIEPRGGRPQPETVSATFAAEDGAAALPVPLDEIAGDEEEEEYDDSRAGDEFTRTGTSEEADWGLAPDAEGGEPDEDAPATGATASGPFTGYERRQYPDPRTAPQSNVREAVLDIVTRDGPLPKESLYRLYRDGCPRVEKAGKYLKQAVNRAVYALERTGQVVSHDEGRRRLSSDVIVALPGQNPAAPRPVGARRLDDVPLAEIATIMRRVLGTERPSSEYERLHLYRQVAGHYGVRRLKALVLERLRRAELVAFGGNDPVFT